MKKRLFFVILILFCTPKLFGQNSVIDAALNDCYTFYYAICDHCIPYEKYWDKASSNNVYGNSNYHGGENQKWIVMPTYPGSTETMLINAAEGKILDRSLSSNNLYCNSMKHHGGENQLFHLDEIRPNNFAIECSDTYKLIDRSMSNGNLYCGTPHYGDNQVFHFIKVSQIPYSINLNVFNSIDGIELPPQPISIDDPGTSNSVKHNYTLVSETIVPFAYVEENNRSWSWQALIHHIIDYSVISITNWLIK